MISKEIANLDFSSFFSFKPQQSCLDSVPLKSAQAQRTRMCFLIFSYFFASIDAGMNSGRWFSEFLLSPVISTEESCLFLILTFFSVQTGLRQKKMTYYSFLKPHALKTEIYWNFLNHMFCNFWLRRLGSSSLYFWRFLKHLLETFRISNCKTDLLLIKLISCENCSFISAACYRSVIVMGLSVTEWLSVV